MNNNNNNNKNVRPIHDEIVTEPNPFTIDCNCIYPEQKNNNNNNNKIKGEKLPIANLLFFFHEHEH